MKAPRSLKLSKALFVSQNKLFQPSNKHSLQTSSSGGLDRSVNSNPFKRTRAQQIQVMELKSLIVTFLLPVDPLILQVNQRKSCKTPVGNSQEEAALAWIAANYLRGSFDVAAELEKYGSFCGV